MIQAACLRDASHMITIPFRNSTYNLQIGEVRHGSDPIRIAVKLSQCLAERMLDSIE